MSEDEVEEKGGKKLDIYTRWRERESGGGGSNLGALLRFPVLRNQDSVTAEPVKQGECVCECGTSEGRLLRKGLEALSAPPIGRQPAKEKSHLCRHFPVQLGKHGQGINLGNTYPAAPLELIKQDW